MPRRKPIGHPDPPAAAPLAACVLCQRPLGQRTERHHLVPKSRGGRAVADVHPICHRAIHAALTNRELERDYADATALRTHPEIARFVAWVASKAPDFHLPTARKLDADEQWRRGRRHG